MADENKIIEIKTKGNISSVQKFVDNLRNLDTGIFQEGTFLIQISDNEFNIYVVKAKYHDLRTLFNLPKPAFVESLAEDVFTQLSFQEHDIENFFTYSEYLIKTKFIHSANSNQDPVSGNWTLNLFNQKYQIFQDLETCFAKQPFYELTLTEQMPSQSEKQKPHYPLSNTHYIKGAKIIHDYSSDNNSSSSSSSSWSWSSSSSFHRSSEVTFEPYKTNNGITVQVKSTVPPEKEMKKEEEKSNEFQFNS